MFFVLFLFSKAIPFVMRCVGLSAGGILYLMHSTGYHRDWIANISCLARESSIRLSLSLARSFQVSDLRRFGNIGEVVCYVGNQADEPGIQRGRPRSTFARSWLDGVVSRIIYSIWLNLTFPAELPFSWLLAGKWPCCVAPR